MDWTELPQDRDVGQYIYIYIYISVYLLCRQTVNVVCRVSFYIVLINGILVHTELETMLRESTMSRKP
jgi:hypothetical protein